MFEKFHRGDIYSADLSPGIGSEQSGSRPVLILQNNVGNCFSPTIIIAAITSVSKKKQKVPHALPLKRQMRFDETICCYAGTDQNNRQVEVKKLYWSSKQG